jgi:uncharacterized protein (DUF1330 family)
MPVYVIVDVDVTDEPRAARYRELSGPSVTRHGGRFVVRGGATSVLEGTWDPGRLVVIEFPTMDAAQDWYGSDDYGEARDVRAGAGEWRMVAVEGVE